MGSRGRGLPEGKGWIRLTGVDTPKSSSSKIENNDSSNNKSDTSNSAHFWSPYYVLDSLPKTLHTCSHLLFIDTQWVGDNNL